MIIREFALRAPEAIKSVSASSTSLNETFNHGLNYQMQRCVDGIFNLWDKIQCNVDISHFSEFNRTVSMSIGGVLKTVAVPGWIITNEVFVNVKDVITQNMTIPYQNGTTQTVILKFFNMTVVNFWNESQSNFPQPPIEPWYQNVSVSPEIGASVLIGSFLALEGLNRDWGRKLVSKIRETAKVFKSAVRA